MTYSEFSELTASIVAEARAERARLTRRLSQLGYPVVPSEANFLLFGDFARGMDTALLWQAFAIEGAQVDDVGLPGYLRVTVGTPEENTTFLQVAERLAPALISP
ncbi:aminotransferase class I/II-fold pyridoxal phosphate-dependent enzyme [Pseudonocardia spinosispora]|uniref:aminotransferase class I/II-fold pyridoxal phosphate-dependent enzyme n=1 Tax=Pseudonocardia spinosispora TaxID=103441 RepID=UPI00146FC0CD|nr:aminotransferase class I/II-fold pyridoxal phosphate-dependent enzyme [Pseudonocardia spinosispora]